VSPEIALIIAPDKAYAALAARAAPIGACRALRRPLLVALLLGVSLALSSTRHVTPELVLSTALLLSGIVIVQVLIALAVIRPRAGRIVPPGRALDLFFASHAPWSLWLLLTAAWVPSPLARPATPLWIASLVPIVLTPRTIAAYFREVLGLDRRRAVARTIVHQVLTWGLLAAAFGAAVAIWPRVLQALS